MAHRAQETNQRNRRWTTPQSFTEEERRAGIVRLLAEAYCARLRKQGKLKKLEGMEKRALPLTKARYDFLQGPRLNAPVQGGR